MAKPSGSMGLNTSHPLYANLVQLTVIEDSGTVRELVSATTGAGGTPVVGLTGGEIGSSTGVYVTLPNDLAPFESAEFSGTGEFTHVWFGDVDVGNISTSEPFLLKISTNTTLSGGPGAYGSALQKQSWDPSHLGLAFYAGWSGAATGVKPIAVPNTDGQQILGVGINVAAGVTSGHAFQGNGTTQYKALTGSTVHTGYDANKNDNTSRNVILNPLTHLTGVPVVYYGATFNIKLSQAQFESLRDDPWGLVVAQQVDPSISSVSGVARNSGVVTITGVGLTPVTHVYLESDTQSFATAQTTFTVVNDTTITWTVDSGNTPYTDDVYSLQVRVRDNPGNKESTMVVVHEPASTRSYVTKAGPQLTGPTSINGFLPFAIEGDQVEYDNLSAGGFAVTIHQNGRIVIAGGADDDMFNARHWDSTNGRGAQASISFLQSAYIYQDTSAQSDASAAPSLTAALLLITSLTSAIDTLPATAVSLVQTGDMAATASASPTATYEFVQDGALQSDSVVAVVAIPEIRMYGVLSSDIVTAPVAAGYVRQDGSGVSTVVTSPAVVPYFAQIGSMGVTAEAAPVITPTSALAGAASATVSVAGVIAAYELVQDGELFDHGVVTAIATPVFRLAGALGCVVVADPRLFGYDPARAIPTVLVSPNLTDLSFRMNIGVAI